MRLLTIIPYRASKNIILLKEKEYDPILLNYVNIDDIELLRDTVSQTYKSEEKLSDNIHTRLTQMMRVSKRRLRYTNWTYSFIQ
jgi:hypothetical protein